MFVPIGQLKFSLRVLIKKCVAARFGEQGVPVGLGGFLADELEKAGLRCFKNNDFLYDHEKNRLDYEDCILAALDRWFVEASRKRTPEEVDDYFRRRD